MNTQVVKRKRYLQRKSRARAKFSGTAERPRLSVYRSLRFIYASLIDDATGKVMITVSDRKDASGTKVERAQVVGKSIADAAKQLNITHVVFDRGGRYYHGRVKALADAARENGLEF